MQTCRSDCSFSLKTQRSEAQKADKEITAWTGQIKADPWLTRLQQSLTNAAWDISEISDGGQPDCYSASYNRLHSKGVFLKKGVGFGHQNTGLNRSAFPGRNVWLSNVLSFVIIVQSSDVWSETQPASCSELQCVSSQGLAVYLYIFINDMEWGSLCQYAAVWVHLKNSWSCCGYYHFICFYCL